MPKTKTFAEMAEEVAVVLLTPGGGKPLAEFRVPRINGSRPATISWGGFVFTPDRYEYNRDKDQMQYVYYPATNYNAERKAD